MSHPAEVPVPTELVRAAIRVTAERGENVSNVPLRVLAAAAGISRSTLVRWVGGSRRVLDEAVHAAEVAAGRIRPMPVTLLIQQLLGVLMLHLLSCPLINEGAGLELPDPDEVCAEFAKAFVRTVGLPEGGPAPASSACP